MSSDHQSPPPVSFNAYKTIRDEIAHEDTLVSARLNWFLASQAFLFSALAIAHKGGVEAPGLSNDYYFPLLPLIAIASDVLIFLGVIAGIVAIARWRRMLEKLPPAPDQLRINRDAKLFALGWIAPLLLPLVFLAAWIYLLLSGWK
jgi:hypothetical protein